MGLDTGVADAAALPSFDSFFGAAPAGTVEAPVKAEKKKSKKDKVAAAAVAVATSAVAASKKVDVKKEKGVAGESAGKKTEEKKPAIAAAPKVQSNREKKRLKSQAKNDAAAGGDAAAGEKRKPGEEPKAEKSSKKAKKTSEKVVAAGGEAMSAEEQEERKHADNKDKEDRTIFVGGVPLSVTTKQLKQFFSDVGEVAMGKLNTDLRDTCNAYVVFKKTSSAVAAVRKGGQTLDAHVIRVDMAAGGTEHATRLSIFVGNLPFHCEEQALRQHFSKCGTVTNIRIIRDKETNLGKGFGYVAFTNGEEIGDALKMTSEKFMNRTLRIFRASSRAAPSAVAP
ncbi:hypothetical protein T484DRAFT_1810861, partial [Baffinella frigidus]